MHTFCTAIIYIDIDVARYCSYRTTNRLCRPCSQQEIRFSKIIEWDELLGRRLKDPRGHLAALLLVIDYYYYYYYYNYYYYYYYYYYFNNDKKRAYAKRNIHELKITSRPNKNHCLAQLR